MKELDGGRGWAFIQFTWSWELNSIRKCNGVFELITESLVIPKVSHTETPNWKVNLFIAQHSYVTQVAEKCPDM